MGVRGLAAFVEERGALLADVRVHDTKLVIDGSGLYHSLCAGTADPRCRRGGDYGPMAAAVAEFFGSLRRCRVAPFVVMDGGRGLDDRKLRARRERAAARLRAARSLSRGTCKRGDGSPRSVPPLLARATFVQAVRALSVPLAQSPAEADCDVAALARHWGCPVLALDSDFCLFDLPGGYCPLSHFRWRDVRDADPGGGGGLCYVPARCFSAARFCAHLGPLPLSLLPLLAALAGNDFGDPAPLEQILGSAHRARPLLPQLLRWLSRFGGPAEAEQALLSRLREPRRGEVRELLRAALRDYGPSDGEPEERFCSGRYCGGAAPPWLCEALARGELDPFVCDVVTVRSVFLPVQVENTGRPSAHGPARPIRQLIYALLLSPAAATGPPTVVCEFDRLQATLKKTFVEPSSLPPDFCDGRYTLDKLPKVPVSCRQMLLLDTLGVKMSSLEPVPSHLQLPVAVTCFWIRCAEPKVALLQLKALLLAIVSGELHRVTNDPDATELPAEEDSAAYSEFLKWKERKWQSEEFELDAAHSFCQWQCCLQMSLYLNQLLCTPLPEPDLSRLYNGTLVHRLYQELQSTPSVENLFSPSPKMTQLYQDLLSTVKS
ncbi:ASTE1 protein, partial [Rhinopomastus cyanomelas]|nr:ASTE1 protein [Rhinopomastus cyanomelas]